MRNLPFVIVALASALVVVPSPAAAQQRSTSALQVGDQVMLKRRGVRLAVEGVVSANTRDSIVVIEDPRQAPMIVAWATVTRAQIGMGRSHVTGLVRGARRGAITGALFGLMISPILIGGCRDVGGSTSCTEVFLGTLGGTTVFGGGVGGVLGFAMGATRWRDLSMSPR